LGTVKVRDIMSSPPIAVRPDATVRELAQIMADNNISGVPVVDEEGFLLGMVSEEDLILQDAELHFPHYLQIFDGVIFVGEYPQV
jgi:predicted transcriptional regulator